MGNDTSPSAAQNPANPQAAPQHVSTEAIAAGAAQPQQPKPQPPNGAGDTPEWLPERLAQAKRTATNELLSALGVKSKDELTTRLAKLGELEKATMTEAEKRQAEIDALKPKADEAERLGKLTDGIVTDLFNALPENQRTAIDQVADGNAEKRWQLMQMFKAAGGVVDATSIPQSPPAPQAPPKPATTTGGAAPPPAPPQAPSSKWDEYQQLMKENPTTAAIFYSANSLAIERSAPADTQE